MKQIDNIDDLIAKYLSGNASPEEALLLQSWKTQSSENLKLFEISCKTHDALKDTLGKKLIDENAAWEILNTRLTTSTTKIIPLYRKAIFFRSVASIALFISLGFLIKWFYTSSNIAPLQITSLNSIKNDTLPDGSSIVLNKNSELTFTQTNNKRSVKLIGEAFFNVIHNDEIPFEININDVIIKDVGTSFNVKAMPNTNSIEVAVESGEVQFYSNTSKGVLLVKGDKAIYNLDTKLFSKFSIDPSENITSYKSNIFLFKNTTLKNAVGQINRVLGSHILLSDSSLLERKLSVEFNNESIDVITSVLAETLDLEIEKKNGSIILKSKQNN